MKIEEVFNWKLQLELIALARLGDGTKNPPEPVVTFLIQDLEAFTLALLLRMIEEAWLYGWNTSGEGFNSEFFDEEYFEERKKRSIKELKNKFLN